MPTTPDGTFYDLHGNEDRPTVALIHGLGLCRHLWKPHLDELSRNYRILNYDLYGHGDSSPIPKEASLTIYSQQLLGLLDHLNIEKAAVVGFSIGGMINRRFALDHRDRLTALAILNSPHDRGEEAQNLVEERAERVREQGAFATMDSALKRWFTKDYLENFEGPSLVKQWRQLVDAESYAQAAWVLANGVRELIAPEKPINVPALVMTSENDSGSTVKMAHDIANEITDSETVIVPSLQHLGLMEDPEAFTKPVLEFLEGALK